MPAGFIQPDKPEPKPELKNELVPRSVGELDTLNAPKAIEAAKNAAVLPLLDTMSAEIVRRFESGELADEFKKMKLPTLINNLTKIIAAMQKSAIVIVNPVVGEKKDSTFLRANSTMHLTEAQKKARREAAIEGEVVKEKP